MTPDYQSHKKKCKRNKRNERLDILYSEFLKIMDALNCLLQHLITYNSGRIPLKWLKSTFLTLRKEPNAKKCDYRIISLMSHLLKTFLKIIHRRISQFGFRDALHTRHRYMYVSQSIQRLLIE